jgi:multidrug efflux system membrane fusion protein
LTVAEPGTVLRLGMTGEAVLAPLVTAQTTADAHPPTAPVFRIPATAIFHRGKEPAVWVIRPDSLVELRLVAVARYDADAVIVTGGLVNGDSIVAAGVHTVHLGERVVPVKPLFDAERP